MAGPHPGLIDPHRPRSDAEAIEQFGDDLAALDRAFTDRVKRMPPATVDKINAIAGQDQLEAIAEAFRALGDALQQELDEAEEETP